MDTNTYTRMAFLLAGLLIVLFANLDLTYVLSKILFWKKPMNSDKDFLTIINLWHQLRNMCDKNEYKEAVEKLNEVFPLLNKGKNDE